MCGPEKSVVPIIGVLRIAGMFPVNGDLQLDLALLFTNFFFVLILIVYSLGEKFRNLFVDEATIWSSFLQFSVVAAVTLVCILQVTVSRSKIKSYLSQCHSLHVRFLDLQFHPRYPLQKNTSQINAVFCITIPLALSDVHIYEYDGLSELYLLVYNFCDAACFLEILLFGQLVEISKTFLSLINRYIKARKVEILSVKEREKMRELLQIFHEVHGICRYLNSIFSVPLLALTAMPFVCMLVDSYHAIDGLSESLRRTELELHYMKFFSRVFWVTYQAYKLYVLLIACSVIQREANTFSVELREIIAMADPGQIVEMEEMIRTHHSIYKKLDFSAADFYELNFSLLLSVVGAVGSYLVILIQFRSTEKAAKNNTLLANQSLLTTLPTTTLATTIRH